MDEKEAQVKNEITEKMEAAALESAAAPAEDPSSEAGQPEAKTNPEQPSEENSGGIFDAENAEADLNSPSPNSSNEVFPPAGDLSAASQEGETVSPQRDFAAEFGFVVDDAGDASHRLPLLVVCHEGNHVAVL